MCVRVTFCVCVCVCVCVCKREREILEKEHKVCFCSESPCYLGGGKVEDSEQIQSWVRAVCVILRVQLTYQSCNTINEKIHSGGFPGGPVAETPRSQFRGLGFDSWLGTRSHTATTKKFHVQQLKVPQAAVKMRDPRCHSQDPARPNK